MEASTKKWLEARAKLIDPATQFTAKSLMSLMLMPRGVDVLPVQSSNIESVGYNAESQVYSVIYKGGQEYRYLGVTEEDVMRVTESDSKGKAVNTFIKRHPFVKMNPDFKNGKDE